jgi:uncharacterized protein (TIGR00288 family)
MREVDSLGVFLDFENLALGLQNRRERFDIKRVLQRLLEKGKIVVKRGYSDWSRYADYKRALHESGFELVEIPQRGMTGKNSADIRLVVDALDMCYSKEHIQTFVIVSGDSDFSPLVAKLKENGKRVIGLAMRSSTSELLVNACDEFIFYDDLAAEPNGGAIDQNLPPDTKDAFKLLLESLAALQREGSGAIYASMVKDTMRRKQPSFHEWTYGYRAFSDLLEEAQGKGLLQLQTDARSGTYVVTGFQAPPVSRKRTRRGGRGRRSSRPEGVAGVAGISTDSGVARDAEGSVAPPPATARRKRAPRRRPSPGNEALPPGPGAPAPRRRRPARQGGGEPGNARGGSPVNERASSSRERTP